MEITLPRYYILSNKVLSDTIPSVLQVLGITPIAAVVYYDVYDLDLARQFSENIIEAAEVSAIEIAVMVSTHFRQPVLLVAANTEILEAVYEDASRKVIDVKSLYKVG